MSAKRLILSTLLIAFLFSCNTNTSKKTYPEEEIAAETEKANAFFQKAFDEAVDRSPMFQAYLGIKKDHDKWDNLSEDFAKKEVEINKASLQWLKDSIDYNALTPEAKTSYDLFVSRCEDDISSFKYFYYDYPVNQMFGMHTTVVNMLSNMHRVDSLPDAKAYINRLNKVPALFDQLIENMKTSEDKGILPPKFVYPMVIDDCKNIISGIPVTETSENPLYSDFKKKVEALSINDEDKNDLLEEATEVLETAVKPAYEKLITFMDGQESRATTDDGVWKFPDGEAYYKYRLKTITTTDLSAEQIHETGIKEVERIQEEMRDIMKQVGFEGDLQGFFKFLREDDQFYYPDTDEGKEVYMDSATTIVNNMKKQLDKLFLTKPKADMIVKRVEAFREKSAGKAFYQSPSKDGSRPGIYYANLADSKNMPKFEMEALAYHEGIPGHHMQLSIAQELEGIPEFRKYGHYTAFSEGWGLYCEFLPKEIGMYKDPYSDYGRLAMELWRACRLVVDTGIHTKKWTREKGIDYYQTNTSGSERECRRMVERHIVMAGQATAYKVGMMKILELREQAKEKLGDQFDIREFHDVVLTSGPVPLDLLEKMVDDWVNSKSS
ncbi:DUF885 domain-containing protein [Galbibacter sp. EGI 63066]|uniref:DUF885 domain-containing protein n=1 Tax=Galbibacter sp. EGI 63066 TaxID=2993559 RepID=UPI0022499CF7|nr:DUF885 domain-containing protein [Galbibacter sp. EGI 63066]MCX2680201.1 DUF885 domain-containing protein [Galbibacter sp. EGI 63066]